MDEPDLQAQGGVSVCVRRFRHYTAAVLPIASRVLLAIAFPNARRQRASTLPIEPGRSGKRLKLTGFSTMPYTRLGERVKYILKTNIDLLFSTLFAHVFCPAPLAAGMASLNLVNQLLKRFLGSDGIGDLAGMQQVMLDLTRGVPYNVTTEMDLFLWETAQKIRSDPASMPILAAERPEEAARCLPRGGFACRRAGGHGNLYGAVWNARGGRDRPGQEALAGRTTADCEGH